MRRQTRAATASRLALTSRPSPTSADSSRDSSGGSDDTSALSVRPFKRRKTVSFPATLVESYRRLMSSVGGTKSEMQTASIIPPARGHTLVYHAPLLLDDRLGPQSREALLAWFDSVSHRRAMPWRKPWLNPADFDRQGDDDDNSNRDAALRKALEKRAYEVWISEIMLQQTRVAVVIEYWKRWMHSWPSIHDLAAASPDDVLAAWRGLGYYSRATRIHEAAKLAVDDPSLRGLLPSSPRELADKIPGVGRYTAGAISAIVFGRPAPMVDGNVLRVLSRQLGIHANVKTDKAAVELIWAAAEELVNATALDGHHLGADEDDGAPRAQDIRNDRPGRWGQALMELGSTVCTPRPDCSQCPITSTCRAYHEGIAISQNASTTAQVPDIEEMCAVCEPMGVEVENSKPNKPSHFAAKAGNKKQATLSAFILKSTPSSEPECKPLASEVIKVISDHASRFPVKTAKKVVREQETLVCAVVRGDGRFLIHRRPPRGLLAGLWEFPSVNVADEDGGAGGIDPGQRMGMAEAYAVRLVGAKQPVEHVGELGSVPWLFSHIKLTMHVHLFRLRGSHDVGVGGASSGRWSDCVEGESMGTGMRKCWDLVKQAA